MIDRRINPDSIDEDLSYIKTTYNLSPNINEADKKSCIKSIKNITLVPRSGTHNNFKFKEEIIIYIVSGALTYSDNLGNTKELTKGTLACINAGQGITYEIFNNGCDLVDFIEINTETSMSTEAKVKDQIKYHTPSVEFSIEDNIPENHWKYRVSSKRGLAPIKSYCDINIYSLNLTQDETIDFKVNRNRQGYLLQGFGGSVFKGFNTNEELTLAGADGLKISDETFEIKSDINSSFLFVETYY